MKKHIVGLCIVFFCVLVAGQAGKRAFLPDFLGNAKTLEDIETLKFQFDFVDNKKNAAYYRDRLKNTKIEDWMDSDYVAVVTATENVTLRTMSALQQVVVDEVIQGTGFQVGDTIEIFENSCFYGQSEDKSVYILDCVMNLMQAGDSYLIFFNEYKHDNLKKKLYEACGGYWQYLNLSNEDPLDLVEDPKATYTYGEFRDYEYFSTSKKTLKARYEIKHALINYWLGK